MFFSRMVRFQTTGAGTGMGHVDPANASRAQSEAALLQAKSNFNVNWSSRIKKLASANIPHGFAAAQSAGKAKHQSVSVALRNREVELGSRAFAAIKSLSAIVR